MRKNNKGFSLVELMVVVAVMAVVTGVSAVGYGRLFSKDAESCARKVASNLQSNRTTAMGKIGSYIKIYVDSSGEVYTQEMIKEYDNTISPPDYVETLLSPEKVGKSRVTVEYLTNYDATYRPIDAAHPLIISFERGTGAVKDMSETNPVLAGYYCTEIKFSAANKTSVITINYLTGKVTVTN